MAKKRKTVTRAVLVVDILGDQVNNNGAEISPGDTVRFHNQNASPRIVKIGIDATCAKFDPLGLFVGAKGYADLYVVNADSKKKRETVYYRVMTEAENRKPFVPHPADDPYTVVVVSSRFDTDQN